MQICKYRRKFWEISVKKWPSRLGQIGGAGGETGGWESEGRSDLVKFFKWFQNGRILNSSMTEPNSIELFNVDFFLAENQASKVKIPLFQGFVPPTHFQKQVGWGTWLASEALTTFWWAQAKDKDKTPNYCRLMKLNLFSYPNSNLEEQWYSLYRYRYWCYTIQSIQKFNSLQKWKYFEILFCMFCMTKEKYQKIQLILFYSGLKVKSIISKFWFWNVNENILHIWMILLWDQRTLRSKHVSTSF